MIVFPTTEQVEVFANDLGGITIKQDQDCLRQDPSVIFIPLMHVDALIKALRQAKKEAVEE